MAESLSKIDAAAEKAFAEAADKKTTAEVTAKPVAAPVQAGCRAGRQDRSRARREG